MIIYPLLFGTIGWPEILVLVLVALLLFGAKRIPELMKSMGKGVRSFKEGLKEIDDQVNQSDDGKKEQ